MRALLLLMGLVGLVLLLTSCQGTLGEPDRGGEEDGKATTVVASEYKFTPAALTATSDEVMRVTISNEGTIAHNFVIPALDVKTPLVEPGKRLTLEFTPRQQGTFEFVCDVPGHETSGMRGELQVAAGA